MSRETIRRYEARVYRNASGQSIPYRLLKPRDTAPGHAWPLILFLHGAGERGRDNQLQLVHFAPVIASDAMMERYPCFVVLPQVPDDSSWAFLQRVDGRITAASTPAPPLAMAMELVGQLRQEFSIDPRRFYVTGISMGGFGTWDLLWREPQQIAAAVPICGGGDPARVPLFKHVPIWAFHGDQDRIVPVETSRVMIAALREAGAAPRYTEYPGVGHDSWTPAYNTPELYEWLFAQSLP